MSLSPPDWDALAPYWEHFENGGFNRKMLATLKSLVRPPLLYVGSGRGSLPAKLAEWFGAAAVQSVDRSIPMCRRARQDFGVSCAAAEAVRLPFPTGRFATVLGATGVLEFMETDGRIAALAELSRVLRPSGQLLITAACSDGDVHWEIDQHQLVEAWYRSQSVPSFDGVACAVGSRDAARDLLRSSLPSQGRAITASELIRAAEGAELEVTSSQINNDGIGVWKLIRPGGAAEAANLTLEK